MMFATIYEIVIIVVDSTCNSLERKTSKHSTSFAISFYLSVPTSFELEKLFEKCLNLEAPRVTTQNKKRFSSIFVRNKQTIFASHRGFCLQHQIRNSSERAHCDNEVDRAKNGYSERRKILTCQHRWSVLRSVKWKSIDCPPGFDFPRAALKSGQLSNSGAAHRSDGKAGATSNQNHREEVVLSLSLTRSVISPVPGHHSSVPRVALRPFCASDRSLFLRWHLATGRPFFKSQNCPHRVTPSFHLRPLRAPFVPSSTSAFLLLLLPSTASSPRPPPLSMCVRLARRNAPRVRPRTP